MSDADAWRPIVAALANPATRHVAARMMLGETLDAATADLAPSRRHRISRTLRAAGLVDADTGSFRPEAFGDLLAASPTPKREGVDRFVRDGRIAQYPADAGERRALLVWVADRSFDTGEVLDEKTVTARLREVSDEPVILRRYLVDFGILARRPDGTGYTRAA